MGVREDSQQCIAEREDERRNVTDAAGWSIGLPLVMCDE